MAPRVELDLGEEEMVLRREAHSVMSLTNQLDHIRLKRHSPETVGDGYGRLHEYRLLGVVKLAPKPDCQARGDSQDDGEYLA